ncbi:hypothetical protein CEP52_003582 [Fusarium oligoseptatum]|uniref:Uncharacterized protein n=1 Tax=Fusarium oligoseptatum TaxID=2604345 RepID=A0A428U8C4_9HYPO|nr:hypothetical protein CEP52_003582 [Fusarium oligoseptatum]
MLNSRWPMARAVEMDLGGGAKERRRSEAARGRGIGSKCGAKTSDGFAAVRLERPGETALEVRQRLAACAGFTIGRCA